LCNDVKKLSQLIKSQVIDKLDHKNLNLDVDFMTGKLCSTENFGHCHMGAIGPTFAWIRGASLHKVV